MTRKDERLGHRLDLKAAFERLDGVQRLVDFAQGDALLLADPGEEAVLVAGLDDDGQPGRRAGIRRPCRRSARRAGLRRRGAGRGRGCPWPWPRPGGRRCGPFPWPCPGRPRPAPSCWRPRTRTSVLWPARSLGPAILTRTAWSPALLGQDGGDLDVGALPGRGDEERAVRRGRSGRRAEAPRPEDGQTGPTECAFIMRPIEISLCDGYETYEFAARCHDVDSVFAMNRYVSADS